MDAQDFFDHIGRSGDVTPVRGHAQVHALLILRGDVDVEVGQDAAHPVAVENHTDPLVQRTPLEPDLGRFGKLALRHLKSALDAGACVFLQQGHRLLKARACRHGVDAPLEAEGSVGGQGVPLGALADGHRLEPGTLQKDAGRAVGDTGVVAPENAGEAHRLFGICDDQVSCIELQGLSIQRGEGLASSSAANFDRGTGHLVRIKGVQGLTEVVKDVVGDVHHVVLGFDANGPQPLLHPIRGWADGDIRQGHTEVQRGAFGIFDVQGNGACSFGQRQAGHVPEVGYGGALAVSPIPFPRCAQVPGHPPVAHGVRSVRGQADFDAVVGLQAQSGRCGGPCCQAAVQDQDAVVIGADAELIFRADHPHRHLSTNLALLDFEGLALQRVARASHGGHHHLLTGGHVGRSADNRERFAVAHVHGGDAKSIRIGVLLTGQDLADHHAFEAAGHSRHFFQPLHFEATGGEDVGHPLRVGGLRLSEGQPGGDPIQRYFHDGRFAAGRARI